MGFLTGKQQQTPAVVLSCTPDVLSGLKIPVARLSQNAITGDSNEIAQKPTSGAFVGSKNGTKYYPPNCSGVSRIKPENYIWFKDAADAELQGYTRISSC